MAPISHVARTDLSVQTTAPRPTPNSGVAFRDIVSRSASSLTREAQAAVTQLPGGPVLAAAMRGLPLGPGATGGAGGGGTLAQGTLSGANRPALSSLQPSVASPIAISSPTSANPLAPAASASTSAAAEGPGAVGTGVEGTGVEGTLQNSQDMNMYYLQLQEAMAAENRQYSACSNVLKARHDTVKNAIGNIR